MVRKVVILNKEGLHARPITIFVCNARKFGSEIVIENDFISVG